MFYEKTTEQIKQKDKIKYINKKMLPILLKIYWIYKLIINKKN